MKFSFSYKLLEYARSISGTAIIPQGPRRYEVWPGSKSPSDLELLYRNIFIIRCIGLYSSLCRLVGRSVGLSVCPLSLRFLSLFPYFFNCFYFWDFCTFLRLLYISETSVHFWDFVHFWVFCIFYEILFREHATYGCWPCLILNLFVVSVGL